MPRFSLRHATRAAAKGLAGHAAGRVQGEAYQRDQERRAFELSLRLAPELRRQSEDDALNAFLAGQEEGRDLPPGLSSSAKLGIYGQRLQARRAERPTPSQEYTRGRHARSDLEARAQSDADYVARSNQNPSVLGIYAYLRSKQTYKKLDDETLRGIAAEAVGPTPRRTRGSYSPADIDALKQALPLP